MNLFHYNYKEIRYYKKLSTVYLLTDSSLYISLYTIDVSVFRFWMVTYATDRVCRTRQFETWQLRYQKNVFPGWNV